MTEVNKEIDFIDLRQRYERLPNGSKAELRRVAEPDEIAEVAAAYRLLPGRELTADLRRVLFCLPWVHHADNRASLGAALGKAGVAEKRLFQVIRSEAPNDLVQLRRLLQWAEPACDWAHLGRELRYWSRESRLSERRLLEHYYLAWNEATRV